MHSFFFLIYCIKQQTRNKGFLQKIFNDICNEFLSTVLQSLRCIHESNASILQSLHATLMPDTG